jgi:major vault protein
MSEANQKDLVLSINEYAYVLDETKGYVSCLVGPIKMSLSQSDKLVTFNTKNKRFEPCSYFDAVSLFKTAPENWYCILKNPAADGRHPTPGTSSTLPDNIQTGRKVNIRGPVSFALFPGQMAKVVKGHSLRSNQYLLARVYEADAANSSQGDIRDAEGNIIETKATYVNGQILVIKGTEVSFYIPPTGIEVIPIHNDDSLGYTREAVTLERLEYCILKDEDGNKRYVHGPEVVFPEPTETFVTSPKGGYIFRAIELSKISGIYVKVIAEYKDEDGTNHPVGEELFITGDQQMIYYPRPEHAIISYDNKIMHHAIAIPEGEGRYVMNRLTGVITTVHGPAMYLPDPRTEVVVKRKLTQRECELMYPGNKQASDYNYQLTEKSVEKSLKNVSLDEFTAFCASSMDSTLANLEAKADISRGTSYTKPRTITLDNKYDGVVSVSVWTGYAVNVVSKNGERHVVCGPQTIQLDYDQTLEELQMSTGCPKTTDELIHTVYLRHENNKVSDLVCVETKDFVKCFIKVSYCVDFLKEYVDKWFNIENYVKYMCDRIRSELKRAAKEYTIEDFYQNYSTIVRNIAIGYNEDVSADSDKRRGRFFSENGMLVHDCEVLSIDIDDEIAEMLKEHQQEMIAQSLKLTDAEKRMVIAQQLALTEKEEQELRSQQLLNSLALQRTEALKKLEIQAEVNRKNEAEKLAAKQAEKDMQTLVDIIHEAELARQEKDNTQTIEYEKQKAEIEKSKQDAYAATVAKIMESIGPDLVAAMNSKSNADMTVAVSKALAPYAIAKDESVAEVVNKLLRGTSLEDVVASKDVNFTI